MKNLILLITKYGSFLLFVVLEFICFLLIINYNPSQKEIWLHSANLFSGRINERVQEVDNFLKLKSINDSLLTENANLLESIINFRIYDKENQFLDFELKLDSIEYKLIPASVSDKTIHLRNNYFTINKGRLAGIESGMGVITKNGIVGIVGKCTENYAQIISLLHSQSRISAMVKSKEYSGTLSWKSNNAQRLQLEHIPKFADISIGDTIVTSGYSVAFPQGIQIGVIEGFDLQAGSDSYITTIKLTNEIAKASHVYIVDFKNKEEKLKLQEVEIE